LATTPVRVPLADPASAIFAGNLRSCAITSGGTYCWGRNLEGQLGTGDTTSYSGPVLASEVVRARQLGLGGSHTCFWNLADELFCFGTNDFGQLGDGTTTAQLAATAVMLD
jgi:alpha-tubulin suppressor-like RCC1 family protein